MQSADGVQGQGQGRKCHVVVLDLVSVRMSDAGTYECVVKPYDGAAVSATVNLTVGGNY